ncbi:helix-turn-helix domain-containing protein [Hansschlegelia zhihuaiae]|uniref:Helix-turn-helix domain-containing protein n=1 Tax=Hansschlegelia zhihuaiae TaxID=405005 RepID=A0A4Q0MJF5_9HYPH|nr:helix-turn-helix domain-containing protein [Hansschlegelia zhihuaiae]RXF73096.1 helix-turn-helix domain-containing protein [Hansschlegelia zhihuaiae]
MSCTQTGMRPPAAAAIQIWDSHYTPASQAFGAFRDVVCSAFMPWTPEPSDPEVQFEGRVENLFLESGSVGLCSTNGLTARKTKGNISNSPVECIYGNYVLAGEISVEQADKRNVARPGDLVLYHSYRPVFLTEKPGVRNVNIAFSIPAARFAGVPNAERRFMNTLVPANRLIDPLAGCFSMLARSMRSSSPEEMSALFDACAALLPVSAGCCAPEAQGRGEWGALPRDILAFVDDNMSDPGLTPQRAAERLGVSTRHLHKLFARSGTTFGGYVTSERLERVRCELMSMSRRAPISELAFRWGFSDLSTFNRAFKRRFGVSPRTLRGSRG